MKTWTFARELYRRCGNNAARACIMGGGGSLFLHYAWMRYLLFAVSCLHLISALRLQLRDYSCEIAVQRSQPSELGDGGGLAAAAAAACANHTAFPFRRPGCNQPASQHACLQRPCPSDTPQNSSPGQRPGVHERMSAWAYERMSAERRTPNAERRALNAERTVQVEPPPGRSCPRSAAARSALSRAARNSSAARNGKMAAAEKGIMHRPQIRSDRTTFRRERSALAGKGKNNAWTMCGQFADNMPTIASCSEDDSCFPLSSLPIVSCKKKSWPR